MEHKVNPVEANAVKAESGGSRTLTRKVSMPRPSADNDRSAVSGAKDLREASEALAEPVEIHPEFDVAGNDVAPDAREENLLSAPVVGALRSATELVASYSERVFRLAHRVEELAEGLLESAAGLLGGMLDGGKEQGPVNDPAKSPVGSLPLRVPSEAPLTSIQLTGGAGSSDGNGKDALLYTLASPLLILKAGKFSWPSRHPFRPASAAPSPAERPG